MEQAQIIATYGVAALLFALAIGLLIFIVVFIWEEFF